MQHLEDGNARSALDRGIAWAHVRGSADLFTRRLSRLFGKARAALHFDAEHVAPLLGLVDNKFGRWFDLLQQLERCQQVRCERIYHVGPIA